MSGVVGQVSPSASTWTDLYTPGSGVTTSLKVIIANRNGSAINYQLSLAPDGDVFDNVQIVRPTKNLDANGSDTSVSFILEGSDVVRVWADTTLVNFTATGVEQ